MSYKCLVFNGYSSPDAHWSWFEAAQPTAVRRSTDTSAEVTAHAQDGASTSQKCSLPDWRSTGTHIRVQWIQCSPINRVARLKTSKKGQPISHVFWTFNRLLTFINSPCDSVMFKFSTGPDLSIFPLGTSLTLIQHRNNVVCLVGYSLFHSQWCSKWAKTCTFNKRLFSLLSLKDFQESCLCFKVWYLLTGIHFFYSHWGAAIPIPR